MSLSKPLELERTSQQLGRGELFRDKSLDYSFFWSRNDSYISTKHGWRIACCLYKWTHPAQPPCCKCVIKGLKR